MDPRALRFAMAVLLLARVASAAVPGSPAALTASVSGRVVTLAWSLPPDSDVPIDYVVEAGTGPGLADAATAPVAGTSLMASGVPDGRYFVRVRARNAEGTGPASNEVEVRVGPAPPAPPVGLAATVTADTVAVTWSASPQGDAPTDYVLEAGSGPGLADVARVVVAAAGVRGAGIPPGAYFLRVRARNTAGVSGATADVLVQVAGLPASGPARPALVAFDQAMRAFMAPRGISAGALAITYGGRLVYERGFGWRDQDRAVPLPPDAVFRLASVTKPISAALVHLAARHGALSLSDAVFCVPGTTRRCHLALVPAGVPDARLKDITLQHLLDHRGGWDRDLSGDPMFQTTAIAAALGIEAPAGKADIARYMMGRPLDFTPGSRDAYSNFGYMLLGLILEPLGGASYTTLVRQFLFGPLGVAPSEVLPGRTRPEERSPREPFYRDPFIGRSPFPPFDAAPAPASFVLENMDAHGGLVASAPAVARFLAAYCMTGQPRTGSCGTWWFYGGLPGTWTLALQLPNGAGLAALFNQRSDPSGLSYEAIKDLLTAAAASVPWATIDQRPPDVPEP